MSEYSPLLLSSYQAVINAYLARSPPLAIITLFVLQNKIVVLMLQIYTICFNPPSKIKKICIKTKKVL